MIVEAGEGKEGGIQPTARSKPTRGRGRGVSTSRGRGVSKPRGKVGSKGWQASQAVLATGKAEIQGVDIVESELVAENGCSATPEPKNK